MPWRANYGHYRIAHTTSTIINYTLHHAAMLSRDRQHCLCVILIGLIRLIGLIGMCRPTGSWLVHFW